MRKMLVFIMVFSFMAGVAQVGATTLYPELVNGDFQTGDFTGWVNGIPPFPTLTDMDMFNSSGNYFAGVQNLQVGVILQLIDESKFPGWNPDFSAKEYVFSADVNITRDASVTMMAFAFTGDLAPGATLSSTPPEDWERFAYQKIDSNTGGEWLQVSLSGTLDYQPQWVLVAVVTEAKLCHAFVDNIDFRAACVPVPPTAVLLGSGLLALVGLRWRKR